jgi:acetoin utilization protein AcuB
VKPGDQIYRWMTPAPAIVSRDTTVATARHVMRRQNVGHLVVRDGGELVGILSDKDLAAVERFIDPLRTRIGYVLTAPPYVAPPYALLADVARHMAQGKYGSAVIVDSGLVVGIFTTNDGLRALSEDRIAMAPSATGPISQRLGATA